MFLPDNVFSPFVVVVRILLIPVKVNKRLKLVVKSRLRNRCFNCILMNTFQSTCGEEEVKGYE